MLFSPKGIGEDYFKKTVLLGETIGNAELVCGIIEEYIGTHLRTWPHSLDPVISHLQNSMIVSILHTLLRVSKDSISGIEMLVLFFFACVHSVMKGEIRNM